MVLSENYDLFVLKKCGSLNSTLGRHFWGVSAVHKDLFERRWRVRCVMPHRETLSAREAPMAEQRIGGGSLQ